MDMNYKFTVSNEREEYSWIENAEFWDESGIQVGEWRKPFSNTPEDSTAFGLIEYYRQSEKAQIEGGLNRVKIEKTELDYSFD